MKNRILLVLAILSLCSCVKSKESLLQNNEEEIFNEFINRFINDSVFRLSRVDFPLRGYNSDDYVEGLNPYYWEKSDWLFYSEEDFKKGNSLELKENEIIKTDTSMIYRIYKKESGYDIKYYFKKDNKKYYLNFYSYKNF
ncbi:hypothetical protein [Flavobacterium sp.]|uniref:hypothetical protein n=1 Tax=Flavobacterium sp. TaxID=239 RepID=UPI002FDA1328